jgi:hypothetical protein
MIFTFILEVKRKEFREEDLWEIKILLSAARKKGNFFK